MGLDSLGGDKAETVKALFAAETPKKLKQLGDAIRAERIEEVHSIAHYLASSFLFVGQVKGVDACRDLEALSTSELKVKGPRLHKTCEAAARSLT